jgi:hypothetical protein
MLNKKTEAKMMAAPEEKNFQKYLSELGRGYRPALVLLAAHQLDLFVALVSNGLVRDGRLDADEARKHPLRKRCRWEQSVALEDLGIGSEDRSAEDTRKSVPAGMTSTGSWKPTKVRVKPPSGVG